MKKVCLGVVAFAVTFAVEPVVAEESAVREGGAAVATEVPVPAEAVEEINAVAKVHAKGPSAKGRVDKDIDDWCKEAGVRLGYVQGKNAFYVKGVERVLDGVNSPTFVKSRSLAFAKAYQNAVAEYIFRRFGKSVSEQYQKVFMDSSVGTDGMAVKDTCDRIAEKTAQLTEAQLDAGLRKMGVEPTGSVVQRRKLAQNMIIRRTVKTASGASAGLLPIQSFEGWDEAGKYAVGVVIRGGAETEIIADCLRRKVRPVLRRPEAGLTVEQALPTDEELVSQFGVRLFFDEKGVPALLSIGQWGSSYTGEDEELAEEAMDHAREQAQDEADDALTMFINSTLTMRRESERGEDSGRNADDMTDGSTVEKAIRASIDRSFRESTMRGEDTMIGRMPVAGFPKVIVHPNNGRQIAVSAIVWSFDQFDAMNRTPPPRKSEGNVSSGNQGPAGNRRGKTYDF